MSDPKFQWRDLNVHGRFWTMEHCAISRDGQNLLLIGDSLIVTSDDSGQSWTGHSLIAGYSVPWQECGCDADRSVILLSNQNSEIYLSVDSGQTWQKLQSPLIGRPCIAMSDDGSHILVGLNGKRVYISSDTGQSWTETRPAGDVDKYWNCCASDSDGSNLIIGVYNGRLYISSNGGTSWTETQPAGNVNKFWEDCSSDGTGTNLLVCVYGGRIYSSSNGGASWTERRPKGDVNGNWLSCAFNTPNSDCAVVVDYYDGPYYSSDSLTSWTPINLYDLPGDTYWKDAKLTSSGTQGVAVSIDLSFLVNFSSGTGVVIGGNYDVLSNDLYTFDKIVISGDGEHIGFVCYKQVFVYNGSDTLEEASIPVGDTEEDLDDICMSYDGSKIVVSGYSMYMSTDGGQTWSVVSSYPGTYGVSFFCDMSSDGSHIVAAEWGGRVYGSTDGGETWTEYQVIDNNMHTWYLVSLDADGSVIVTACERVYLSTNYGSSWSEIRPIGDVESFWWSCDTNVDGSVIIITDWDGVYLSKDGGANWTDITYTVEGDVEVYGVMTDWSGNLLGFCGTTSTTSIYSFLMISDDGGETFDYEYKIEATEFLSYPFHSCSSDSTGQTLAAGRYGYLPITSIPSGQAPVITDQSHDTIVAFGGTLELYVVAEGEDLEYQWYHNDQEIPGATESTYTVEKVNSSHDGVYYCVVSNSYGEAQSEDIKVLVIFPTISKNMFTLPSDYGYETL